MTLLKNSYPLVLNRHLACILGLNEAGRHCCRFRYDARILTFQRRSIIKSSQCDFGYIKKK